MPQREVVRVTGPSPGDIAIWRKDYNEVKPHGTIGRIPPVALAAKHRNPNPSNTEAGSVNLQTLRPLSN